MTQERKSEIVQIKRDAWYCVVEPAHSSGDDFDWREDASAYGPFRDEAAAEEYLTNQLGIRHGWWLNPLASIVTERDLRSDATLKRLIKTAKAP
jgi:hypothetical protein